jgi:chemotaxis protein MotB
MRRRTPRHPQNHERWLVSYADFITLLFAFFVVMFASTQANQARAISNSVREALEQGQLSAVLSAVLQRDRRETGNTAAEPGPAAAESLPLPMRTLEPPQQRDLTESLSQLKKGLREELMAGKVKVNLESRGLIISLRESAFFASADDAVAPASLPTLAKIAAVIRDLPNPVRLEGHTDSIPIHNSRFRSNWELSSARAIAMLELLRERFQILTARMSIAGYAENAPADSNETPEGRAHNRRVDVVVLSAEGMRAEPK